MYWFISGSILGAVPWLVTMLVWLAGGYLIAAYGFHMERDENLPVGFGIGLVFYLFFINLSGRFLQPVFAFSLSGGMVLLVGLFFLLGSESDRFHLNGDHIKKFIHQNNPAVPWVLMGFLLFILFLFISRGLAIFDEPKNLTLTSLMAQGDIPPHYYMNADYYFRYHYGFQLLPASLMRLGGTFPWSAFDIGKSIVFACALVFAGILGKRVTRHWGGAVLFAAVLMLGSGLRYLLLLLPQSFLTSLDARIQLVGTSAAVGLPFSQALWEGWSIQGGPPVPFPFAFLNGIFPPLVMSHHGTSALSAMLLLLLLLLVPHQTRWHSGWVIAVILAVWALTWESSYGLFVLAGILLCVLKIWRKRLHWRQCLHSNLFTQLCFPILVSLFLAAIQGGVLTEVVRSAIFGIAGTGIGVEGEVAGLGFGLRWPLAIITSHFSPLNLTNPGEMVVGLLELGPVFLLAPVITIWIFKSRSQSVPEQPIVEVLALSAWIGFLLPVFLVYQADRDITRFSGYAMSVWILFLAWMLFDFRGKFYRLLRLAGSVSLGLAILGGGVILVTEMSAITTPVLGFALNGLDARISQDSWGKLEDSLIFDPGLWRASALTGLKTRAAVGNSPLTEWEQLVGNPDPQQILKQGFRYIYFNDTWWETLSAAEQDDLLGPCSRILEDVWDAKQIHFRRLVDLAGCE